VRKQINFGLYESVRVKTQSEVKKTHMPAELADEIFAGEHAKTLAVEEEKKKLSFDGKTLEEIINLIDSGMVSNQAHLLDDTPENIAQLQKLCDGRLNVAFGRDKETGKIKLF
jgi:hypothetical protein